MQAVQAEKSSLQAQIRAPQQELDDMREKKEEDEGADDEDEEMEEEGQAEAKADIPKIAELQRSYDVMAAQLGGEDYAVCKLKDRLEAARAAQRATKPLLVQIQAAERRFERLDAAIKASEKARTEIEKEQEQLKAKL